MNKSESISKLAGALLKAQGKIKYALKESDNPFFHSKYADLESVWNACRGPLNENGLCVVQTFDTETGGNSILETMLLHESGEWIIGRQPLTPVKFDPQGLASASTYARRYGLAAMVGVIQADDDGNAGSGKEAPQNTSESSQDAKFDRPEPKTHTISARQPERPATGEHAEIQESGGDSVIIIGELVEMSPCKNKKGDPGQVFKVTDVTVRNWDKKLFGLVEQFKHKYVKAFCTKKIANGTTFYSMIAIAPKDPNEKVMHPVEKLPEDVPWGKEENATTEEQEKIPF